MGSCWSHFTKAKRGLSCLGCKGREESPKIIKKPLKVNRLPEEVGLDRVNISHQLSSFNSLDCGSSERLILTGGFEHKIPKIYFQDFGQEEEEDVPQLTGIRNLGAEFRKSTKLIYNYFSESDYESEYENELEDKVEEWDCENQRVQFNCAPSKDSLDLETYRTLRKLSTLPEMCEDIEVNSPSCEQICSYVPPLNLSGPEPSDIDDIKFELPNNHTGTDFFVSKFDKIRKSITDNSVLN
ncbi:uncharacterized protein LOC111715392 [Eurytemora carolleeae]|uniref:uncharacterized protein LOC111715392 n=1 Tax=Eurytemora carolleeae TaxID=1294199 RepID=UPI000C769823|nr:uncharacterized protein LOC111715392 [Eurytemora carolleeae]|eukprot:XP_023346470.1 uncharacterized protein LOC111715392 [Eurytemora affinis]